MDYFQIPSNAAQIAEQLGSRDKYWFTDHESGRRRLFKVGRPHTGEHWSEVVVARIYRKLEIPHAEYRLATDGHQVGVVTSLSRYKALDGRLAVETFGDYLILDALVANQDRHHENWGLLELPDGSRVLAPTFDHAASLACRLSDEEREARLNTNDSGYHIRHFAQRAKTWLYETDESQMRLTTLGAAQIRYNSVWN